MTSHKFDIFEVIKDIQSRNISFFDHLEDYEVKQISPFVIMKWLSGVKDKQQILLLNEVVNERIFLLSKHNKLLYKMLMTTCTLKDKRCFWIKRPSKKSTSQSLNIISDYYNCSIDDAKLYMKSNSLEDIIDMAESLGHDKEVIAKIKKELNDK